MLVDGFRFWQLASFLIEVSLAAGGIVGAIRRSPGDRVLLFEFLALASFFFGALALRILGFVWQEALIWILLFFTFTLLAAYSGFTNWRRRKRKSD